MKIGTLSLVTPAGCDGHCPYCVSRMTGLCNGGDVTVPRNFRKACDIAKEGGVTTVIITGKGEPMLYPDLIHTFMQSIGNKDELYRYNFPFIELQTNGLAMAKSMDQRGTIKQQQLAMDLERWKIMGATHVALSVVHYQQKRNREIYCPKDKHYNIAKMVERLHAIGYTVRLNCIMVKGYIDTATKVRALIRYCKKHDVDQLSIRPVTVPANAKNNRVAKWAEAHNVWETLEDIKGMIKGQGEQLLRLPHGAAIYDFEGQNVCLTDCLTHNEAPDEMRQIILLPDGRVMYDWQYEGAVLLR